MALTLYGQGVHGRFRGAEPCSVTVRCFCWTQSCLSVSVRKICSEWGLCYHGVPRRGHCVHRRLTCDLTQEYARRATYQQR